MAKSSQRGLALVLVVILGVLLMGVWAVAYRSTRDTIRAERLTVLRGKRDTSVTVCLARALALLRTGTPAAEPVSYIFTVGERGEEKYCTVTYSHHGKGTWDVESRVATRRETATLARVPSTFQIDRRGKPHGGQDKEGRGKGRGKRARGQVRDKKTR